MGTFSIIGNNKVGNIKNMAERELFENEMRLLLRISVWHGFLKLDWRGTNDSFRVHVWVLYALAIKN